MFPGHSYLNLLEVRIVFWLQQTIKDFFSLSMSSRSACFTLRIPGQAKLNSETLSQVNVRIKWLGLSNSGLVFNMTMQSFPSIF